MTQGIQLGNQYTTAPAAAYAGMLAGDDESNIRTMNNAGSASIAFGAAVIFKASPTTDKDASLPGSSGDHFAGVAVHSHDFERQFTIQGPSGATTVGELDSTGITVGAEFGVLYLGVIWVLVSQAVVRGSSPVYYSYGTGGSVWATSAGLWGISSDVNSTLLTNASWESSAASGGFAKLRIGAALS